MVDISSRLQSAKHSNAGPFTYIRDPDMAITFPADILVPDGGYPAICAYSDYKVQSLSGDRCLFCLFCFLPDDVIQIWPLSSQEPHGASRVHVCSTEALN